LDPKTVRFCRLDPPGLELRFREEALPQDIRHVRVMGIIVTTTLLLLGALDFIVAEALAVTVTSRVIAALIIAGLIVRLYRPMSVRAIDLIVSLALWVFITHNLILSLYRPPDYTLGIAYNVTTVLAIYTAVPVSLRIQLWPALFLTLADCSLWLVYRETQWGSLAIISATASYGLANTLGIYASYQLNRSRRQQYLLLQRERKARKQMEMASDEIKVLRGMIPICCMCKRIRVDEGYFEAVEDYIRRFSEADFTHTLCPECLAKHYPDYSAEVTLDLHNPSIDLRTRP
jgi:hypothetical protein